MECSSVVFQEEENAHTEEQMTTIEFPENADDFQEVDSPSGQESSTPSRRESPSRQKNSPSRQENSKLNHSIVETAHWLRAAGRCHIYLSQR